MSLNPARIGWLDIAITAVAVGLATFYMSMQPTDPELPDASWWAVPFFALIAVPLLWRRVSPLVAAGGCAALAGLHVALFTDTVIRCGILIPLCFILAFAVGARLDLNPALLGLGFCLLVGFFGCAFDGPTGADVWAMTFVAPVAAAVWVVGRIVRSRGRMVTELQKRTEELRTARDERARLEVADDRARLSAELDGLLQRRLTLLVEMADGGDAADPEAAAATLARIEAESRGTLEEMRAMVGVLRDDATDAEIAAQPALTQLEGLLVRAKGAGARLTVEGSPRALPAGVELSAYRVVEHLLDAVQDAPGVEVGVRFADQALELRVTGPMRRRGAAAIERARERAALDHGRLEATTDGGRAVAVVSLPILAAV
ncbi:MAG: sensor histidine kinase [Thermoleophilia bacterium]